MSDGSQWMMEYHPRSRPAHAGPYLFLHLRSIAMDGAFLAGRLVITETASVKSAVGIIQQLPATGA